MRIDVRPTARLRGSDPVELTAPLGPLLQALREGSIDLSRTRVVCDWIQYRNNFREAIDSRPILAPTAPPGVSADDGPHEDAVELAVDLRRHGDIDVHSATRQVLNGRANPDALGRVYLEPWRPGKDSCIWGFNGLYWQALSLWEDATGRKYEQALPGGESDARNREAVRSLIQDLFKVWGDLRARNALPEELYVVELGVGNGNQAKTWLDEFLALDRAQGHDYYRRLHYLMGDYSPHVLSQAQVTVAEHADRVSSLVLDATEPTKALRFLRHKAFLVYISNVYDNLPTDEIANIGGRAYRVEVRAFLPYAAATRLAGAAATSLDALPGLVGKLLRLGPELLTEVLPGNFPAVEDAVRFWQGVWTALRLAERYVPVEGLDRYDVTPRVGGETLRPLLEAEGDVRMHVNNGAVASFDDTLELLHPYGRIQCHDLFATDLHQYRTGFRGPGKYEGSVVNWVNGPLLEHLGVRRGFDVSYTPFSHNSRSNIMTLTAQVRE